MRLSTVQVGLVGFSTDPVRTVLFDQDGSVKVDGLVWNNTGPVCSEQVRYSMMRYVVVQHWYGMGTVEYPRFRAHGQ